MSIQIENVLDNQEILEEKTNQINSKKPEIVSDIEKKANAILSNFAFSKKAESLQGKASKEVSVSDADKIQELAKKNQVGTAPTTTVFDLPREKPKVPFTDLAWGAVQTGINREKDGSVKLKEVSKEVRSHIGTIDLLLELSGKLSGLDPNKKTVEITEEMKELQGKIRERGVEIPLPEGSFRREEIHQIKSVISSRIDHLRTQMQTTISTKIQVEMTNMQTIMNAVRDIIRSDERMKRKTLERPRT